MEGKKISFGFKKTKKAESLPNNAEEEKKEFIECMEEKSIKIVGGEIVKEDTPLVIPMKPNTLMTAERLQEIAVKVESAVIEPDIKQEPMFIEEPQPENETLEQMAVRELMQEAKKEVKVEPQDFTIAVPAKPVMSGEKESTLDDYEAVPVQQFGMAMLRGMGWTPNKDGTKYKQPELRPKGLGLGADKVIKENQKKQSSKSNKDEELAIVKNAFVRIATGKYSGYYGKVVSLDEDNGRVMVDIAVKKETVSLSEFMMNAVSKLEYDRESKVINTNSFEEYKRNERGSQNPSKLEEKASSSYRNVSDRHIDDNRRHREGKSSNGRHRKERDRKDSSSSEDRPSRRKKKAKKRYSSSDSLSSYSDERRHKKKHKSRRHSTSLSSENSHRSPTPKGKRDIDKKRKGKKKKRDRDRSPNYKKHRK